MPDIELDKRRVFGTLHTGRAASALRSDECPTFRNVQHDVDGITRKRSGLALVGGLAGASEPDCWEQDVIEDDEGEYEEGIYYVRLTHVTLAGETDIVRMEGRPFEIDDAGQALSVLHPFHMREMVVGTFHDVPATTAGLPAFPPSALVETPIVDFDMGPYLGGTFSATIGIPGDSTLAPQSIKPGSVAITFDGGGSVTITDDGAGAMVGTGVNVGTIDYTTGIIVVTWTVEPTGNVTGDWIVWLVGRVIMLELVDGPPLSILESCENAYAGFLVYSRAPRLQDQTRLGANFEAATPTYNRLKPLCEVYSFGSYLGNPVFVMSQVIPQIGQTGKIDRDTVDIMMQDRAGLPVQWFNVYVAPAVDGVDGGEYRWAGSGTHGAHPVVCRAYNANGIHSPLDRVNRDRPIVTVQNATDLAPDGCIIPGNSRIMGGLIAIRSTWSMSEKSVMQAPGWSVAAPELELGGRRAPLRCRQESWPSRVAYVEVFDGQQIDVERAEIPSTVAGWNIYAGYCAPHRILTFEDSARIPDDTNILHHTTPAAEWGTSLDNPNSAPAQGGTYTEFVDDNAVPTPPGTQDDARGFPGAYAQIRPFDDPGENDFRFASSSDASATIRFRLYFPLDAVTDAADLALTKHVVFRLFMRTRRGRVFSYHPGIVLSNPVAFPKIRYWSALAGEWVTVVSAASLSGGFVEHNIPLAFPVPGDATSLFSISNGDRRFCCVDILEQSSVGVDFCEPDLRLYRQDEASDDLAAIEPAFDHDVIQREDETAEVVSLRIPLAREMWWNRTLRPDNTAMWPLQGFAQSIPGNRGPKGQSIQRVFGAGDSMFRMLPSGVFERVYQYEGLKYADVVSDDFHMCNYLWRLFFCNPGLPDWNLRFDQQQTWPMGIAPIDDLGSIISVNQPAPGPGVQEDVQIEYYAVVCRFVLTNSTTGNGYVSRSEPFKFTQTVSVNIKDGTESACLVRGIVEVEPEVTHIELYRNVVDTAFYKRCAIIPITEDVVLADGRVNIDVEDVFDGTDADLDLDLQFDTGRPPAARFMIFNRGRVHFVPQGDPERDYFTNVTSPNGLPNPEGWYDQNSIDPPLKIASAITSLEGSDSSLRISTQRGMARVDGISDDQDGPNAFSFVTISADGGWIAPRAWYEINDVTYGMTSVGPAVRNGDQLEFVGAPCKKFISAARLDSGNAAASWCVQDPDGRLWFAFSDDPMGCINGEMVLDQAKRGDGIQPYWSEWRIHAHSCLLVDLYTGKPVLMLGGEDGRVYRYGGRFRTDAGIFIDAEMVTRPEGLAGALDNARPDRCIWTIHGDRQDVVLVDVRKDMNIQLNLNENPARIHCNDAPVDARRQPIPLFGVGEFVPGSGQEYGLPDAHEEIERTSRLSTSFRQIQFRVWQEEDDMPSGTRREAGFDVAGYCLAAKRQSPRRAG